MKPNLTTSFKTFKQMKIFEEGVQIKIDDAFYNISTKNINWLKIKTKQTNKINNIVIYTYINNVGTIVYYFMYT